MLSRISKTLLFIVVTVIFNASNISADQLNDLIKQYPFSNNYAAQVLKTDKNAYGSGEIVVITGSGYNSFEQINLDIDSYNFYAGDNISLSNWTVFADQKGRFQTSINIDSLNTGSGSFNVRATGTDGKSYAETFFSAVLAASADLDQCRNGSDGTSQCTGNNWVNGNLGSSNSSFVEGEFVPYRMLIDDAAGDGTTVNTLIIEYDTSQSGKHALDYIGTYNSNETNANPCDYAGCPFSGPSTFAVPTDSMVTNGPNGISGGGDDITQIPGNITIWGGTITNVSLGTFSGNFAGNSKRQVVVNFTSTVPNPVLAWGGHVSTRINWGVGNSAVSLPGSPYHMRLISINGGGGNQDMSMSVDALLFPSILTIVKDALPNSESDFTFTVTGPGVTSPITLDDDSGTPGENATYSNSVVFSNIQSFGAGNEITVTEGMTAGWTLRSVNCVEQDGGLGTSNTGSSTSVGLRNAVIRTQEGEIITCTFTNEVVLAAKASIEGTVTDISGRGLPNAIVKATKLSNGETITVLTNPFGFYRIEDLPVNENYLVRVSSKRYIFSPDSTIITLNDNAAGLNFSANSER